MYLISIKMIKKKPLVLALVFLLLFSSPLIALDNLYKAELERVIDGDTIVVDLDLGLGIRLDDQHVRLYRIDAWEVTGENKEKGLEAKEYLLERLVEGEIIIGISPEWGRDGKDAFGRWLGVVYVDGVNMNDELVEKGHAEEYK